MEHEFVSSLLLSARNSRIRHLRSALEEHLITDLANLIVTYDGDVPVTLVLVSTGAYRTQIVPQWNQWCIQQKVVLCIKKKEACNLASVLDWIQRINLRDAVVVINDTPSNAITRYPLDALKAQEYARNRSLSIHVFPSRAPPLKGGARYTTRTGQPCACACCGDPSIAHPYRRGTWSFVLPRTLPTYLRRRIRRPTPPPSSTV
jgi:hypothetical protein